MSFARSCNAEIIPDRRIYAPGDKLSGNVIMNVGSRAQVDKVTATLRATVAVRFDRRRKIIVGGMSEMDIQRYEHELVMYEESQNLWTQEKAVRETARRLSALSIHSTHSVHSTHSADSDTSTRIRSASTLLSPPQCGPSTSCFGLAAGEHSFPFHFRLPDSGLHTSFDAVDSPLRIRYQIVVRTQSGEAESQRGECLIAVVVPHPLIAPYQPPPTSFVSTVQGGKGELTVQLSLEKTHFLPGEPVLGSVTIHNKTKKSVKFAHFRILHAISCFATFPTNARCDRSLGTASAAAPIDKIRAGQSHTYALTFNIPALVPPINVPDVAFSEYFAQLRVGFYRDSPRAAIVDIRIPIKIGTEIMELPEEKAVPSAPPAYVESETAEPSTHFNIPTILTPSPNVKMEFLAPPQYSKWDASDDDRSAWSS